MKFDVLLEQLRIGTIKVRNVLGDDVSVSNKEIEDSLWHYYYEVDKTVNYLLGRSCDFNHNSGIFPLTCRRSNDQIWTQKS